MFIHHPMNNFPFWAFTILFSLQRCVWISMQILWKVSRCVAVLCFSLGICWFTNHLTAVEGTRKYMVTLGGVSHTDEPITSFPFALVFQCERLIDQTLSQCITGISRCLENRMESFSNNLLKSYVKLVR